MKTGLKRNIIDKFYTKECIINDIFNIIEKYNLYNDDDLIIEPSAGNGSFLNKLVKYDYVAYDIEPEDKRIIKKDFLEVELDMDKNIHFIGNPPFGRQSSLAKKFIKKCISCKNTKSISFILPLSFKKNTMNKVFGENFHLLYENVLDKKSFFYENKDYNVPCIFQIWIYKNEKRIIKQEVTNNLFTWINKKNKETADFAIRRVGGNAGYITENIMDVSEQSHYYIKLNNINKKTFLEAYNNIIFDFNNTVGPKSINRAEICKQVKLSIK